MRNAAEAEGRRLLRLLFVWDDAVPTDAGARRLL
jgi:hypothetical protein